jgi:hypothetical protein
MLRIVLKLHHPQLVVRAQHQVTLRSAPHPPDLLNRLDRQFAAPNPALTRYPDSTRMTNNSKQLPGMYF